MAVWKQRRPEEPPTIPEPHEAARSPQPALTVELLDWAIHAVTAVLSTDTVRDSRLKGPRQRLRDALLQLDTLYPYTAEVQRDSRLHELETRPTGVPAHEPLDPEVPAL